MRLEGRVALVTGGGRGIGRATCLALAREGADVAVCDIDLASAESVAKEVEALGRKALAIRADVSQKADVTAMVARVTEAFGKIDILVNNAGVIRDAMLHKMTEEAFDQVIAVHLKGAWLCCQAVMEGMRERRFGKIINLSSLSGKVGNIGQTNYSAAKAGIVGLTKAVAKELARYNINVNAIQPGFIDTDMTRSIPEEIRLAKIAEIPLQRVGRPEDIANVVVFLASEDSSYMTGAVLEVNGGRGM
ncbi:MAG: 3-oxoacyl-ACP reductase FabG [candidate division NC10 bacterium]|nr:3-oxoacyl-ACP reductase FabG [candidate division NC10 bacterium]